MFTVADQILMKRLALVIVNGLIRKVFYPVFPPDQNASVVIDWLEANAVEPRTDDRARAGIRCSATTRAKTSRCSMPPGSTIATGAAAGTVAGGGVTGAASTQPIEPSWANVHVNFARHWVEAWSIAAVLFGSTESPDLRRRSDRGSPRPSRSDRRTADRRWPRSPPR